MAKFTDLNEQDRIQYIKDGFILILEQLAKDPSKLKNYIKLDKPKLNVPALEIIKEEMTENDKKLVEDRNRIVQAKVDAENTKIETEYKTKEEVFAKVEAIVSKLQKKEGCLCGSCINVNITNNVVPPELDVLI